MTAEQQLERSVLEGKERDELSAIAQAMSLKTTSRTKKADIIDQILDATGVTSGASSNGDGEHDASNGTKPARRTRSATATADGGDGASGDDGGEGAGTPAPAEAEAAAPETTTTTAAAPDGDSGPAVFVEPPELADGADPGPRQNGQGQGGQGQGEGGQGGSRTARHSPATATVRTRATRATRTAATSPTAMWATGAAGAAGDATAARGRRAPGRRAGAALLGRDGRGEGHARPARRGLRLPALRGLPSLGQGRVRLHQPGPALRAAARRLRRGRLPPGVEQREVPGAPAHRLHLRPRPRGSARTVPASRT